ncbi:hypothetical protein PGT21_013042 [Puccinia graminis f. sp. tritici]|uniref:Uncharacterized protein n=1 Tax=Puccinia graminis f. sp. tritici TaxID=56615 RepID=A0A5B0LKW7_PUCGR|nr:hypothetical protein PGT21_013042 [Puccinia graminis f. sp. tritici]
MLYCVGAQSVRCFCIAVVTSAPHKGGQDKRIHKAGPDPGRSRVYYGQHSER